MLNLCQGSSVWPHYFFFHGLASLWLPLGSDVEFHFGDNEHEICPTVSTTPGILSVFSPDNDTVNKCLEWGGWVAARLQVRRRKVVLVMRKSHASFQ